MNNNASPADTRASRTLGTVKKRTMTCGSPAVPTISASVIQNTSIMLFEPLVYCVKPRDVTMSSSLSSRLDPSTTLPNASWGIALPVICSAMKIAGTV